jgi:putative hydrolase of HD superfamily
MIFQTNLDISFVVEIDKLKTIVRRTKIYSADRLENTAEHSWHLATSVWALNEYANEAIDIPRAIKMALAHDIVEIDAGDTFVYDLKATESKAELEQKAAQRLFAISSLDSLKEMHNLWLDYEKQECPESKFVGALDRFLPMLANHMTDYFSWRNYKVSLDQIYNRNKKIEVGSKKLWQLAEMIIQDAQKKGLFHEQLPKW